MKRFALLIALSMFCNDANAELKRLGNSNVYVEDSIPGLTLPAEVKNMTPAEFKAWAMAFNERQYAEARERHEAALARGEFKGIDGYRNHTSGRSDTRYSSGPGGFIPRGGYYGGGNYGSGLSYGLIRSLGNGLSLTAGYYGNNGSSGGYYGGPYNSTTTNSVDTTEYMTHWNDPNDNGGGPVTIINPYCWEYWVRHTDAE